MIVVLHGHNLYYFFVEKLYDASIENDITTQLTASFSGPEDKIFLLLQIDSVNFPHKSPLFTTRITSLSRCMHHENILI